MNEMLNYYEQEVGKNLCMCEQQPTLPKDDKTSNPITTNLQIVERKT